MQNRGGGGDKRYFPCSASMEMQQARYKYNANYAQSLLFTNFQLKSVGEKNKLLFGGQYTFNVLMVQG